ncbi:MAG: ABC transporter ATP-binding protein, partial [Thermoanaerobaculia bacterium]|nr:ABC transporter ATP-binding protein [Thermoanaerobaculia bacterium]
PPPAEMSFADRSSPRSAPSGPRMDLRSLRRNAAWSFSLAWTTSPGFTAGLILLALVRGTVPAGLALFARGLINVSADLLGNESPDLGPVVLWLVIGCLLSMIEAMSPAATHLCQNRLRDELNLRITTEILEHAGTLDLEFFESPKKREVIERAREDAASHAASFLTQSIEIGTTSLQLGSLIAILALIEPLVVVVLTPFAIPYLIFKWRLAGQRYYVLHERTEKKRWTRYFVSLLTGRDSVAETKMLGLAPHLVARFRSLMESFRDRDLLLHRKEFLGSWLFGVAMTLAFFGIFYRVVQQAIGGNLTIGDVAVFGGVSTRLRQAVDRAVIAISGAMSETLHLSNLMQFLGEEPTIPVAADAKPVAGVGSIEFEDVWFTYPGARDATLKGVTFRIEKGEVAGLVGENGAGKTTLVKLVCRLYDPDRGCIRFDGVDVRELSLEQLRAAIAFVFQGFGRYEATAGDNIAYGDWRQLLEDAGRVERIARRAGVDDLVSSMPQGYQTFVGRNFGEYDISGGQWQYLALARAFAREASLLILDEPTASLDAGAEYALFERFRELARGRTTLLISHRFSTQGMADHNLVMDDGRIVERGTHAELVASGGTYAALYRLHRRQLSDDDEAAAAP